MLIGSNFSPPVTVLLRTNRHKFFAASSAVVNHFFDKQIDSKMNRTSNSRSSWVIFQTNKQLFFLFYSMCLDLQCC